MTVNQYLGRRHRRCLPLILILMLCCGQHAFALVLNASKADQENSDPGVRPERLHARADAPNVLV